MIYRYIHYHGLHIRNGHEFPDEIRKNCRIVLVGPILNNVRESLSQQKEIASTTNMY